ncbi:amino acid ABC transporter permease [Desulfosarcina widdelii]|uniref:Putative glutamine transport system permease protein GlnP n=1 Tax=Desulfosarcina widdelii TaxID=947919 RepID=A0A5K7Z878_9BACT|nr:amino acid ABC transporter permease [Desulfosarcina widdelii]BBO77258.1 amino acid ABC transporter permease [Desulfosarcina widdelii]
MNDFQLSIIFDNHRELLAGAAITLKITAISFILALVIGAVVGIARSRPGLRRWLFTPYVEVFRGTPLLIQLFFIYYALPVAGITMDNLVAAYVGVGLCGGAYISEIVRGALYSVESGQREAALSLGLSPVQAMVHVILPQAMRVAIPPLMNAFSAQLKETSLVSVLAINELTRCGQMVYSRTFRPFEIYTAVAVIYFVMTFSVSLLSRRLERVFHVSGRVSAEQRNG